jgi:hypothetical protein
MSTLADLTEPNARHINAIDLLALVDGSALLL